MGNVATSSEIEHRTFGEARVGARRKVRFYVKQFYWIGGVLMEIAQGVTALEWQFAQARKSV